MPVLRQTAYVTSHTVRLNHQEIGSKSRGGPGNSTPKCTPVLNEVLMHMHQKFVIECGQILPCGLPARQAPSRRSRLFRFQAGDVNGGTDHAALVIEPDHESAALRIDIG